jgi:pimeloyl-ACP methyl ester carboxylesterase
MIHAFPGMGADQRMFPAPWRQLPDLVIHDWQPYSGELSIPQLAATIVRTRGIRDGDILIGSSLGGMVAGEITKLLAIPELYLVGSAVGKQELHGLLTVMLPLAQVAPIDWLRFSAGQLPHDLMQMFADADTAFIRSMCKAITHWDGLRATQTEIWRLHGSRDLLILPPPRVDLLLEGGHLIAMTHAEECVSFIRDRISRRSS